MKSLKLIIFLTFVCGLIFYFQPAGVTATDQQTVNFNPLGGSQEVTIEDPRQTVGTIINAVLGVVGSIALLIFVYGGISWMISRGNKEKVDKARKILVWAALGLAIILLSYFITRSLFRFATKYKIIEDNGSAVNLPAAESSQQINLKVLI